MKYINVAFSLLLATSANAAFMGGELIFCCCIIVLLML
jgi:hypothetical protein